MHRSHKPPSSDGLQKKTTKPGLPKDTKGKNGGQVGHKGNTLKRVAKPDHVKVHLPRQCQCCGRQFAPDEAHQILQSRQVFDLPEPKLEVTEHRLAQVECCGHLQVGDYPPEVAASVQYGPGVRALVTKLSVEHKTCAESRAEPVEALVLSLSKHCRSMPLEQISLLFEDMYGYDVSTGSTHRLNSATIEDALERAYELAEPIEAQIVAQLSEAELAHFDETGVRVAGKLHWLHVASTETLTHLFVHETCAEHSRSKRGADALNAEVSVLKDFTGTAVHDCWPPYFNFTQAWHVLCGAHLLRELQGLWENGSLWAEDMHGLLLALYKLTLGRRIMDGLYDLLAVLVRAKYHRDKREKLRLLEPLNPELELLRHQSRLLHQFELFDAKRYEHAARGLDGIGVELGGWLKALSKADETA